MAQKVLYNHNGRADTIILQPSSVDLGNVTNEAQIPKSIVTAKGDIITATGNATPARQGVGGNGQILAGDSNLANGIGYKDPAFRNWVMNGNMEVSQRGTSWTNPVSALYNVDRFSVNFSAGGGTHPNVVISQQPITPGELLNSYYFHRINVDGAGSSLGNSSYYAVRTNIEYGTGLLCGLNKKITLTFYARSSIADKKLGCFFYQYYGSGGSPSSIESIPGDHFHLTSDWQKYSVTITTNTLSGKTFGTNNDNYIIVYLIYQWGYNFRVSVNDTVAETFVGSGNIDIAQVALYAGDVAYPFEPVPFDIELQRCMRYYEKSYSTTIAPGTVTDSGIVSSSMTSVWYLAQITVKYSVPKRISSPNITIYSPYNGNSGYGSMKASDGTYNSEKAAGGNNTSRSNNSFNIQSVNGDFSSGYRFDFHWTCDADF